MGFVKVNFDGNVRGAMGGVGYVIRDSYGKLLAVGGSFYLEPWILKVELRTLWTGITYSTQELRAEKIFLREILPLSSAGFKRG